MIRSEPATPRDDRRVLSLLQASGLMAEFAPDEFVVAREGATVLACARLRPLGEGAFELASVAVAHARRGTGLGDAVTRAALARAPVGSAVYALALQPKFFERFGFGTIPREALPLTLASKVSSCDVTSGAWTPMRRAAPPGA